jgi:isopenicillin N synthase-like dioxygenase
MTDAASLESLPVLDLQRYAGTAAERAEFLAELRRAARHEGFFYLVGHGIPEALTQRILGLARRFFDLPEAEKLAIENVNSPQFRGYTRIGNELTRGQTDWREQIDIGAERPAVEAAPDTPSWLRLEGPNLWPAALPEFKPALLDFQARLTELAFHLLGAFATALEQPANVFDHLLAERPTLLLKVIRYPGREAADSDQGVGPHKDTGFLTFVLQDVQSGLEVAAADGWIKAPPLAGSLVVNVGEMLELATDGYLRANIHRVVTPPAGSDRLSLAYFLNPRLDAIVEVLKLAPHLAAEAQGPSSDPANPLLQRVGENILKSQLRSHPEVARRHYAGLPQRSGAEGSTR